MKKLMVMGLTIFGLLLAAGCSNAEETGTKEKDETKAKTTHVAKKDGPVKTVNSIEMKFVDASITENGKGNKRIAKLNMSFKNDSDSSFGIGGGDFVLKNEKKTYQVDPASNNIGTEIQKGKTASGALYFEIPKVTQKEWTLEYKPVDPNKKQKEVLASWKISLAE
ncbi:DUF4352 domain-containing protein [Listeria kieliensis]|uniref:DUF4352 domain-containing protein n=1 Tax=Listeria kieliensis TaxID=1621700 RepID=A0A3D8TQ74_9LIST|nr:DUF4352 domain-containing protein [Listeria kieliensis]RDX00847.1 hypothetical protein UR08_07695 [Listeria kieliensis]